MEPFKNSFYSIATECADLNSATSAVQRTVIDELTAESPMLSSLPFEQSSHAYHNLAERLTDVKGVEIVDLDGQLPVMDIETQLVQSDLTPIGGKIIMPEDKMIRYGGKEQYLAKRLPVLMRHSGGKIEKSLFLQNFLGAAVEFGNAYSVMASPVDDTNNQAMVAVTWTPGEMSGLFSPLPYQAPNLGEVFNLQWLNGGNRYEYPINGIDVTVYGVTVKTLIGMQLGNTQKLSALVNIRNDNLPTPNQLVTLIESARGGASTRIYCSPSLMHRIAAKYAQSQQGNGLITVGVNGDVMVLGIPFVTSFNIPTKVGKIDVPVTPA